MRTRRNALIGVCALALSLAVVPAEARLGVDEEAARPTLANAPSGYGGSGSAGFHEDEGGFVLKSSDGDYKLLIGGRLQPRFDYIGWDDVREIDNTVTFSLHRVRGYLLGHVLGKKNRYFVQFGADAPRAYWDGRKSVGDIEFFDAWMKHIFSEGAAIKFGQFKTPFSRQYLTSGGKLQLPDRALATETLGFDYRDIGLEVSGGFNEGIVQYAAAIVNGDGRNTMNQDDNVAFFGRISVNPSGDYGYSEGDMGREDPEEIATTLGFAVHATKAERDEFATDFLRFNVDGGIKYKGLSVQGEFYSTKVDPEEEGDVTNTSFYIQGGYFVMPEKVEIAARGSRVLLDGDDNDSSEFSLGVNYFIWGHRLKWQAAYSYFSHQAEEIDNLKDHRFVAQAQLWF